MRGAFGHSIRVENPMHEATDGEAQACGGVADSKSS